MKSLDRPCTARKVGYNWRIGASLLDVGAIRFSNSTRAYKMVVNEDRLFDAQALEDIQSVDALMDSLNYMFYDNPEKADNGKSALMGLPTAASLQFDYCISDNLYFNATWIQPVKLLRCSSQRAAMLIIEPRYESQFLDFTLPITLYNYDKVFVGAAVRVAFLTVGTHNVFNLLSSPRCRRSLTSTWPSCPSTSLTR